MGSISKRRPYFPYPTLRKVSGFGLTTILGINTNACFGQSSLTGLGDLPGGGFQSVANDVSADGTVVVGSGSAASRTEAVRWTSNGGMQNLSDQANGFFFVASAVSGDGSVVVLDGLTGCYRWTEVDGLTAIVDNTLGSTSVGTLFGARDVSTDGNVIVGTRFDFTGNQAYTWTVSGGINYLGYLAGGSMVSFGYATNSNGSVVVGEAGNSNGKNEAFRWTQSGGMVGLGFVPGKDIYSAAYDVSDDGSIVVGTSSGGTQFNRINEAFRWTQATGIVGLGDIAGGTGSNAQAISHDGSVIVGASSTVSGRTAWRWTQAGGMLKIEDWLTAAGVGLGAFSTFESANGTNRDGSVVVGYGQSNNGTEAFIAKVGQRGSGAVGLTDLRNSLASQVATHTQFEVLNSLVLNGAHHKSLMDFSSQRGARSAWMIGDLGRVYHNGDGQLQLAEVGVFQDLFHSEFRLGAGAGHSHGTFNQAFGGFNRLSGEYGLLELDRNIPDTSLVASVLGVAGVWNADIRRAYSAGNAISSGSTDVTSGSVRARLDWKNAFAIRAWSYSPMTQFTVTRTGVQAYTEQGGTAPASFDSQLHTANESRLGMTAGRPIDQKTQWLLHSEWAHRFDDESSRVSGNANVLESIMVPYAFNGNPTKQDWMRFRSELIHDLNEFQRLSIAGTVATIGQDPDLTLSMQWNSLF